MLFYFLLFLLEFCDQAPVPAIDAEFRETASAVYDFSTSDYSTISSGKATNLPSATTVSAPSGLTLTDELVQYNDGTVIVKLVINFTAPTDNFSEIFEVEVKQLTDADGNSVSDDFKLIGRGARTKFEFLNVIDKAQYQVRVRSVNIFGVKSSTITANGAASTAATLIIGNKGTQLDVSLANGTTIGEYKIFTNKGAGDMHVTPATFRGTDTKFVLAQFDGCTCIWDGASWFLVGNQGEVTVS